MPAAIDHRVDEDRRDLVTLGDHRGQVLAWDGEHLRGFLRDRIGRRTDQARVGQHPGDVSIPPLHQLVSPGAPVDEEGNAAAQDHEESNNRRTFGAQDLAGIEMSQRSVSGQPFELAARRSANSPVSGESIDEICGGHLSAPDR